MSNRKVATNSDVRTPLLAALVHEQKRATNVGNTRRVQEIDGILSALNNIWPGLVQQPVSLPAEPVQPTFLPVAPAIAPEVTPALYAPPAQPQPTTNLRLASLQSILEAADPEPIRIPPIRVPETPAGWRQRAKAAVMKAVNEVNAQLAAGRPLYEQALMAHNGKVEPLAGLKLAASIQGVTVDVLVGQIIGEYDAKGRRTMYIYTLQTKAEADIDQAETGDQADAIAQAAVQAIRGDNE
jgi:hypothetical protein